MQRCDTSAATPGDGMGPVVEIVSRYIYLPHWGSKIAKI